jgi:hypothetical protein
MQCFYCISVQGGELVAITGPLPNKYFILFYLIFVFNLPPKLHHCSYM